MGPLHPAPTKRKKPLFMGCSHSWSDQTINTERSEIEKKIT